MASSSSSVPNVPLLSLRTIAGPVGLRQKRRQVDMATESGRRTIKAKWLSDTQGGLEYRKCVKQAMLVASEEIRIVDAEDPLQAKYTPEELESFQAKKQALLAGQQRVPVSNSKKKTLKKLEAKEERKRDILIKFSKKCCGATCNRRVRAFIIESGELQIFYYKAKEATIKDTIQLKDVTCFYETPSTAVVPRWEQGHKDRLRLDVPDRQRQRKNPLYLYPNEPDPEKRRHKVEQWKRAFQLAKVLVSENDRRALKISIGRATSQGLMKAWDVLVMYYKEIAGTKKMVRQMALRLMKADLSRGWNKFSLVYRNNVEQEKRRQEKQTWAARFMSEKLGKFGAQNAKSYADVRESMITKIQQRFRNYREDMIFDRTYPLDSTKVSRVQQAKLGRVVDFAMRSLSMDEVLSISLKGNCLKKWREEQSIYMNTKSTYSEASVGVSTVTVYVSDNLTCLSFSNQTQETSAYSALNKADWSKFVNLDRVSSIVLHTEPDPKAAPPKAGADDEGVWLTINGPRVCWDRKPPRTDGQIKEDAKVLGAADGFAVPNAIATMGELRWVKIKVEIKEAPAWLEQVEGVRTLVKLHLLGWCHDLALPGLQREGEMTFCMAQVPVGCDDFVALDQGELGVEVWRVKQGITKYGYEGEERTLQYVGKESLATLYGVGGEGQNQGGESALLTKAVLDGKAECDIQLGTPGVPPGAKKEDIKSLRLKLESPGGALSKKNYLDKDKSSGGLKVPVACVSPEIVGGGVPTALYTSHNGAWFDANLAAGKFRIDHVANFIEISLGQLRFPEEDPTQTGSSLYRIKAITHGACATSMSLHRPGKSWAEVVGRAYGETNCIRFSGCKLYLPMQPGGWSTFAQGSSPPSLKIKLQVIKVEKKPVQEVNYSEFLASSRINAPVQQEVEKVVSEADLILNHLLMVDQVKHITAAMIEPRSGGQVPEIPVYGQTQMQPGQEKDEVLLSLELAMRDRSYVRINMGKATERRALCVGDKAMLTVQEPLDYPQSSEEFRKRFCPGTFEKKNVGHSWPEGRGCKLREPCLSSEYADSGLGDIVPKVVFKQSFIPTFCTDIIPHRFVLPVTEKEFEDRHLPGYYDEIIEDLFKHRDDEKKRGRGYGADNRGGPKASVTRPVVSHLQRIKKQVPVTLLCMYANGTCDIELGKEFLTAWQQSRNRKYAIPGNLEMDKTQERGILKGVPTSLLSAVHYTGINVYDSAFKKSSDVLAAPAPENDFNPLMKDTLKELEAANSQKRFIIASGPLPPDASPAACQYEWSIRVRCPNEYEMYQLAAMLRRCVRMDHYQQASKMLEYQSKIASDQAQQQQQALQQQAQQQQQQRVPYGGQLDIILVEARRLLPKQSMLRKLMQGDRSGTAYQNIVNPTSSPIRTDQAVDENYLPTLMGTTGGEAAKGTPEGSNINVFVNFRLIHNREVVPYRGQKVQQSPVIGGTDSPSWQQKQELQSSGGWTFRTGTIDPDKFQDLIIDFEVMQAHIGFSTRIGQIQIPVTDRQFLTNPAEPFKNLWLPLVHVKDGAPIPNPTGEIHIMTRWLPAEKLQVLSDGSQKQQVSVRSSFLKELWPRLCAQRLKEPVYGLETHYLGKSYNPNLVKPKPALADASAPTPEAPKDHVRRHAEELANALPYIECLERRQARAWEDFENALHAELPGVRLGERRLMWQEANDEDPLGQLQELVQRGIPGAKRERVWSELTFSSRVLERDGAGSRAQHVEGEAAVRAAEQEYKQLLERGLPQNSDAMRQMQEDAFHLACWETSVPLNGEQMDVHLRRLRKAQNVVAALLACQGSNIAYSESLLVLAFFLLLPQGSRQEKVENDGAVTVLSENSVFWLLYTLICTRVNGTYKEYYGIVQQAPAEDMLDSVPQQSLVTVSGAYDDVVLLECCLSYHESAIWRRMTSLGFMLSSVFYGAFMRLFATYMPTATVFRFWDILFAQSTDPKAQPHARAYLIDLAFGVIRSRKVEILACESAAEIQALILGVLGTLYDTCTAVDITMQSHQFLWGSGGGFGSTKVGYLWTQRQDLFAQVKLTIQEQNRVLKQLTHLSSLQGVVSNSAQDQRDVRMKGCTTRDLTKDIVPVLKQLLDGDSQNSSRRGWGMYRPMPQATRILCESSFEQTWHMFQHSLKASPTLYPKPYVVRPPGPIDDRTPGLEPLSVNFNNFSGALERVVPTWGRQGMATAVWNAFMDNRQRLQVSFANGYSNMGYGNQSVAAGMMQSLAYAASNYNATNQQVDASGNAVPPTMVQSFMQRIFNCSNTSPEVVERIRATMHDGEERVSLNEIFISLIAASRGTLGEKALHLFQMFSYSEPLATLSYHKTPVTRLAKSLTNVLQEGATEALGKAVSEEDQFKHCLRLKVMSNYPTNNNEIGNVFIANLTPFVVFGGAEPRPTVYNIWGRPVNTQRKGAGGSDRSGLVCVGEITLAVTWTPRSISKPQEGQLGLHLHGVKFHKLYISDFYKINPWIDVYMCQEQHGVGRSWAKIPRWDPRTLVGNSMHRSKLTTYGAYGGQIKFDKTVRDGLFGHHDSQYRYIRDGGNMGYSEDTQEWVWNEVWGKQFSTEGLEMLPEFVKISTQQRVMDLAACRLLVGCLLQRCSVSVTNRQALMIADAAFNRSGVVPGILEAVLKPGWTEEGQMKDAEISKMKDAQDVTKEVMMEHELQIANNGGCLNLFSLRYLQYFSFTHSKADDSSCTFNLKDMGITDPFPDRNKELWVRFVRGGDGERCLGAVRFNEEGTIRLLNGKQYNPSLANLCENERCRQKFDAQRQLDADYPVCEKCGRQQPKRSSPELVMDLPDDDPGAWPHRKVTREEFVSCMLEDPLLSESLRRLGSCDHELQPKRSIPLEVTIMDPHHEEEDEMLLDAMDVQQSVLFEIWDWDIATKDFLGEAWLPPLSNFGPRMKDIVLPLQKADLTEDGEHGKTRTAMGFNKDLGDDRKDENKKITGELFVSVSWTFPAFDTQALEQDIETWLKDMKIDTKVKRQAWDQKPNWRTPADIAKDSVNSSGDVKADFFASFFEKSLTKDDRKNISKFFKDNTKKEDLKDRADEEQKKHTGKLKIVIKKARGLRRADAAKRRDCDPQVQVWLRNDAAMQWRKKPMMKTKTITNNRNPVWEGVYPCEQEINLMTGSYEARVGLPEEGWTAEFFKAVRTKKAQRIIDETRQMNAVKRFGSAGVRIKFIDASARAEQERSAQRRGAQQQGENHRVEVYLGDSISEFKNKLTLACAQEAEYWKATKGEMCEEAQKYSNIQIGYKHLAMVFVPSQKVKQLYQQNLRDSEEYKRAYEQAWHDPSSWQPLEQSRSFSQYPQYAFGRMRQEIPIRVVEATEQYKAQNIRYKQMDQELSVKGYQDANDSKECFGWAKYTHTGDQNSTEWRPAFISKSKENDEEFQVKWVFETGKDMSKDKRAPAGNVSSAASAGRGLVNSRVSRRDVLLAPRMPAITDVEDRRHREILEQAVALRQSGKSDWEIEPLLNKLLNDKFDEERVTSGLDPSQRPPPITVDIIRTYLQKRDEQAATTAAS